MTGPVLLTGADLDTLLDAFQHITNPDHPRPHLIQIWVDDGGVKLKVNQGSWSPPLGHHE